MPLDDRYGNAIGTSSTTARDRYVEGVDHVLAGTYGGSVSFSAAIEADPDFALAHVGLARALMYEGDMTGAQNAISRARSLADATSAREHEHIAAFEALLAGDVREARARVEAHVLTHPRDALVAQICTNVFGLIGFSGEIAREAELLAYTTSLLPYYGDDWWMMSMHALSLCETGAVTESLDLMERSLALNPSNANGSHFKAHAQYEAGNATSGLEFLTEWMEGYDPRSVIHGHLSWHMALWALELGDVERMWSILDSAIAPGRSHALPINVLTDTAALLYRAELAGVPVSPDRWKSLSDYAARFFPQTGQSFADMHAALCHAMAGEGDRLARYAEAGTGFAADLVRPVAQAWHAIAREDWRGALELLMPVMASHVRLGGSRAQRDLLEMTYLNVLIRLGLTDEARRTIATRRPVFARKAPVAGYG